MISALLAGATLLLLAAAPPGDGAVPTGEDGRVRLLVELADVEPPPLGLSAGEDDAAFDALEAAQTAAAADLDAAFADVDVDGRFETLALLAVSAPPESVEAIEDLPRSRA